MKSIDIPDVGVVDFPDEMDDDAITRAIQKDIIPQAKAEAAERKRAEDYLSGQESEDDRPGYISNIARGIGERALELTSGGLRFLGQPAEEAHDWLERNIPLGTIGSPGTPLSEEEIQKPNLPFVGWADALADTKLGYEQRTSTQDVKDNWFNAVPFAAEQGLRSIPDIAAIALNLPAYAAAHTGEIAQARAKNDDRDHATVEDLIKSAPAGIASTLLERIGAHGMMGLGDDAIRALSQLPGAIGKAAVKEGGTEFLQEGTDYLGETLGTRKGSDLGEGLERAMFGAIAGAPFGGGVRGLTGTVQVWAADRGVAPTVENVQAAAAQGDSQAIDILKASGLMSDEQIANLSPEAAERFAERWQSRLAADKDPVLAAQRTQEARDRADLEGGDPLPEDRRKYVDKRAEYGGPTREAVLKAYETATEQVDRAIEAGDVKPKERDLAIRERVVGFIPELDKRQEVDPDKLTMMRARIDEIIHTPADQHTDELADEYVRLKTIVDRSKPARVIELGERHPEMTGKPEAGTPINAVDGKAATGYTDNAGLRRAVETAAILHQPKRIGRGPGMSDAEVAYAQALARRTQEEAARNQAPGTAYGSEDRLPQTRDDIADQRKAEDAFRLVAGKQASEKQPTGGYRARLDESAAKEEVNRDPSLGGRPAGGVESQKPVFLDQGYPVRVTGDRFVKNAAGDTVRVATVHRYDPRTEKATGPFDPKTNEPIGYEVQADSLTMAKYAQEPRRAQEFEKDARTAEVAPYVVEPHRDAAGKIVESDAVGKTVKPGAAGARIDTVQGPQDVPKPGLPRQTYRTTEPDPALPGAEGPTSELPDGGPVPRAKRPEQGEGPSYDLGSGKRGANARGGTTGEEWTQQEAKRRQRMNEQAARGETQDEQGQPNDWGSAKEKYANQKTGFSGKPKGVDEDGWPHVDEYGYILSDKVGPIRFSPDDIGKGAMKKRLIELRKAHPDAMIVNTLHPGPMRKTGRDSADSYHTLQAMNPKPAKAEQAQQEQAAPEQPAQTERALPGPAPTPDPTPETSQTDTGPYDPDAPENAERTRRLRGVADRYEALGDADRATLFRGKADKAAKPTVTGKGSTDNLDGWERMVKLDEEKAAGKHTVTQPAKRGPAAPKLIDDIDAEMAVPEEGQAAENFAEGVKHVPPHIKKAATDRMNELQRLRAERGYNGEDEPPGYMKPHAIGKIDDLASTLRGAYNRYVKFLGAFKSGRNASKATKDGAREKVYTAETVGRELRKLQAEIAKPLPTEQELEQDVSKWSVFQLDNHIKTYGDNSEDGAAALAELRKRPGWGNRRPNEVIKERQKIIKQLRAAKPQDNYAELEAKAADLEEDLARDPGWDGVRRQINRQTGELENMTPRQIAEMLRQNAAEERERGAGLKTKKAKETSAATVRSLEGEAGRIEAKLAPREGKAAPEERTEEAPEPEPEPASEPDVPAKGTHRVVDGVDVVATGNPDHPWAGGRHVESGPNAGWQPDRSAGQGGTAEEAAANVLSTRRKVEADRQKIRDVDQRWNSAVSQAKTGAALDADTLKGVSKFGDGKVTTGDAKSFLRAMGLNSKQTDDAVSKVTALDKTEGGAWLYDLKHIVRAGQNVLGVGEGVRTIEVGDGRYGINEHNQIRYPNDLWMPVIIGSNEGDTYLTFNAGERDGAYEFLEDRIHKNPQKLAGVKFNEGTWKAIYADAPSQTGSYTAGDPKSIAEVMNKLEQSSRKWPGSKPKVEEAAPKPTAVKAERTVAAGVRQARAAVEAGNATWLEQHVVSLHSDLEHRKANKQKLAQEARDAAAAYDADSHGKRTLGGLAYTAQKKDSTSRERYNNLDEIKKGEAKLKELVAQLPVDPPKRKARAALLSRLFGRDPKAELTAEQETADEAAWKERLEQIAPRAETVEDIERVLDENVGRGILNKGTAKGIKSILGRMPTDGLKGIRLMIQDRMTADEREILGTAKGVSGEYFTLNDDPDTRVLTVLGENGSKDAVETFVHENAHVLFGAISNPDKALARQIYDRLPISRQALHTVGYDQDARFEEWFAESAVDYYADGLKIDGQRAGIPHMLGGLMQRLYKRVVDTFSNEKAQVDAFFSGLERSLGYAGPVSIDGITRRERRGVSTLALLSTPISKLTGDWKAWKAGGQDIARDFKEALQNRGKRPDRQYAITSLARSIFYSADGEFRAGIGKFDSPTLNMLADVFHPKAGASQGIDRKLAAKLDMKLDSNATFDEAVTRKMNADLRRLDRVLAAFRNDKAALNRIVDLVQRPSTRRSDPESVAAGELARMLRDIHRYMKDAGVDVGEIKNGYFPREIDVGKVLKDHVGFVAAATKAYRATGLGAKEASAAADEWLTNVLYGGSGSPAHDVKGGSPSFVQSRVLTKRADEILKDFYQRDPDAILGSYISRAAKRAEIARRFGDNWKNWDKIKKQIREEDPAAAGMLNHLNSYAATATGTQHYNVPSIIRQGSSLIRTFASLGLLEKGTFSSLAEAITPAIRTGSARDFLPAIGTTLNELRRHLKGMPPSAAAELAADIGAIAGSGVNSIMAARFAGGDLLGRTQANVLDKYFRRIGLTQWTDATRISATARGAVFIRRLARDIAGRGLDPTKSRIYMAELGIPEAQLDEFVKFVNAFGDDLPSPADLNKGGAMGTAYRTALLRFDDQTIMHPNATTRPRWASHPVGAIAFQLQAFNYAFAKNVLLRGTRLAQTAWNNKENLDAYDRLLMLAPLVMLAPLAMVQYIVGWLRDLLFSDPERRNALSPAAKVERAISRAGLTGALDPYIQMVSGARYQRDPLSTLIGPSLGMLSQGVSAVTQLFANNTPNTNATERKVSEAVYDLLIEPITNMLLGFAPVSPMTGLITAGLLPAMRDDFVDGVAGPRLGHKQQPIYGLSELMMGKQFHDGGSSGSWSTGSSASWSSGGSSKSWSTGN